MPEITGHDGPIGTATIRIVPDLTGFTESLTKAQHAIILHGFAMWLKKNGHLIGQAPSRIVDEYLATTTESDESADEA